ncbi:MAG: helix-turn-helix domain-containing protein [Oscillospiraceae bacterium]
MDKPYSFGDILRQLRTDKGLTQKQLADKLELSVTAVSKYELGTAYPPFEKMRGISAIFNVTMDYLYGMETSTSISTVNLSGKQADILRSLANQFRRNNGVYDKKTTEEQYALLGKIVCEMIK